MIRNFFTHVLDSLKNLRRNGWMTVAAVSSVTITLTLLGIFLSVIINTTKLTSDIEDNVRIITYLKLDQHDGDEEYKDSKDKTKIIKNENYHKVYDQIEALDNVSSITYSSKEEQLKKLTATLGKDWNLFEGDANPLYDVYIVEANNPKNVKSLAKKIERIDGVKSAEYGGVNTDRLFSLAKVIKTWGMAGAGLLVFVAIFLISNTIRITIISRSREIQIMSLVGAKKSYIRWPFFLEGAWVGLIGAIIPSIIINYSYTVTYNTFARNLLDQGLSMYTPGYFLPRMIALLFVLGALIGSIGSVLSMRKFLKI